MNKLLLKLLNKYKGQDVEYLGDLLFLFKLGGDPVSLDDHYIFRPQFMTKQHKRTLWKVARQLGKTTNAIALPTLIRSVLIDNWTTLTIAPRFEQAKRISTDFTDPFINSSDFKGAFKDSTSRQSVLDKTFSNGSHAYYSYAYLDCGRIRGIPGVDCWNIDEVQDMNWDFIPIIRETASASQFGYECFCGTPLTLDSTIERLWQEGTQSECIFRCEHCNTHNIPSVEYDLLKMIGLKGPICRSCGRLLDIYSGKWEARYPERQYDMVSRHLAQPMSPIHSITPQKWQDLLYKVNHYDTGKLYNEVFGESYDTADKLFSLTTIKNASVGVSMDIKEARRRASNLKNVAIGVDWTGGGVDSDSYTAIVIGGLRPGTDLIEVVWVERIPKHFTPDQECARAIQLKNEFRAHYIAHDYGGVGRGIEHLLLQMGLTQKELIPFSYVISPKKDIVYADMLESGQRRCYNLDKIRSLVVLSSMIRAHKIILPEWTAQEKRQGGNPFRDMLSLVTEQKESLSGSDLFYIRRSAGVPDDTAHALNLLCTSIWYTQGKYPNVAEAMQLRMTHEQIAQIAPQSPDWYS
jgi:hypothetical protein